MGTRILFEAENVPPGEKKDRGGPRVHLLSDVRIEFAEVPCGGGSDFHAVYLDSISLFT